jgi:hypothetical protein
MDQPLLGCKASALEVGMEFSCDEGRSWLVVRTEPRYVDEDAECLTLRFMASPNETTSLSAWEEVCLEDNDHVLLERNWKG